MSEARAAHGLGKVIDVHLRTWSGDRQRRKRPYGAAWPGEDEDEDVCFGAENGWNRNRWNMMESGHGLEDQHDLMIKCLQKKHDSPFKT